MRQEETLYTVGEVAQTLGVSVRTLHHWEAQGLISPAGRSWSNYRLYTPEDITTLQHILIYRATGMKLADIKETLASGHKNLEHLRKQRQALVQQQEELSAMLAAIDTLMEKEMKEEKLTLEQIGDILGDANFADHQAQAQEAYGDTDDWAISQQRTANWGRSDWEANQQHFDQLHQQLAQAVRDQLAADSPQAAELVLAHRQLLSSFFLVTPAKHYLISRTYISDQRFTRYYDSQQPGLANWLADAIAVQAQAEGVDLTNPSWD